MKKLSIEGIVGMVFGLVVLFMMIFQLSSRITNVIGSVIFWGILSIFIPIAIAVIVYLYYEDRSGL